MSRRKRLDNLLKFALEAHGGLRAWDKLQSLRANVSIGGALWDLKHIPGLLAKINVEYFEQDEKGAPSAPTIASWDLKQNKK